MGEQWVLGPTLAIEVKPNSEKSEIKGCLDDDDGIQQGTVLDPWLTQISGNRIVVVVDKRSILT